MNPLHDIERFSRLHSWFRHLSFQGKNFLMFPWKGEQPKNYFQPEVEDHDNPHWWIWDAADIDEIPLSGKAKDLIMRYPVTFNCFLRGTDKDTRGARYVQGWSIIEKINPEISMEIANAHPHIHDITNIVEIEHITQIHEAVIQAHRIYLILAEQCPEVLKVENMVSHTEIPHKDLSPSLRRKRKAKHIKPMTEIIVTDIDSDGDHTPDSTGARLFRKLSKLSLKDPSDH